MYSMESPNAVLPINVKEDGTLTEVFRVWGDERENMFICVQTRGLPRCIYAFIYRMSMDLTMNK